MNRKNKAILEDVRFGCRIVVSANELPALVDQAEALLNRSLILKFTKTFKGREDVSLKSKLERELPSILLWAVHGLSRLLANQHFTEVKTAQTLKNELAAILSPVGEFVREKCIVGEAEAVERDELYGAWKSYCEGEGKKEPGTRSIFGRNLRSVLPSVCDGRGTDPNNKRRRPWMYKGLRLRTIEEGDPESDAESDAESDSDPGHENEFAEIF